MKRITLASLLTAAFAISLSTYAQAQSSGPFTDREIGDREGCHDCTPRWGLSGSRLSCGQAKARVRSSGFRNVTTVECQGRTYTFDATRRGRDVRVFVNSRNGAVWRG